jgi:hypothetical protein
MEGAWLMLAYVGLEWLTRAGLPLNILHFSLAVALGMVVARIGRGLSQARFALGIAATAVFAAVVAALSSGGGAPDASAFVRGLVLNPGTWLLGLAVVRGAIQSEPRSGYATEQLFRFVVPVLVVYWVAANALQLTHDLTFTTAAFTATLTFVSAGLLAMGLSRLDDLQVEAVDRAARRRWLALLVAIVGVVLVIGIPLSVVLGVPVSAAAAGVLGPLAPVLIVIFSILSIPIFWLLDALGRLIGNPSSVPVPSVAVPSPIGSGPPPLFQPGSASPPELTWLLIVLLLAGFFVLVRVLAVLLGKPGLKPDTSKAEEVRGREEIALPGLPQLPRIHIPRRRAAPRTAAEAYELALQAVANGPHAREPIETPREHADRIRGSELGRDIWWLASDYQLDAFAARVLTARENNRAIERWRRVARRAGKVRPHSSGVG